MTIEQWYNSEPVKNFRMSILADKKLSACRSCYLEEAHGGHSRRSKENQKSAIFHQAFEHSFDQSPGIVHFLHSKKTQGVTKTMPIDLHVNLGNFCNLACKMCSAEASTSIASQQVKWGIDTAKQYLGVDWTKNTMIWDSFKQQLLAIKGLNNIHFMGGETLLTEQFEDLVDTMIAHGRFDLCFSFVTNGTVFKPTLMDKLKLFKRVGIEVSIETTTEHNAYQRQGTDTALVLANIDRYRSWCNGSSITVTLRSAPSLLSIGYYHSLLKYALDQKLLIKSNLCYSPSFLYAINLPESVKQLYQQPYTDLLQQLGNIDTDPDINASDPNNYTQVVKYEAEMCLQLLSTPDPVDIEHQLQTMVAHCRRWDQIYHLDARKLYPELAGIWDKYAY